MLRYFRCWPRAQGQGFERLVLAMELARKPTFIQRLHVPMLLHVAAGGGQVTAEKMRPQQGRGEDLGVGEVTPMGAPAGG